MKSIFLSYSSHDSGFARRLAADLESVGIRVWFDEAELKIGDSLIDRISGAIGEMDAFAVVLSKHSIKSRWVQVELKMAIMKELNSKDVIILPILIEKVPVPSFLLDKVYADFTLGDLYEASLKKLVYSLNAVTASHAIVSRDPGRRSEAIRLAIKMLNGTYACHVAPNISSRIENRARLKCRISFEEEILAIVTEAIFFFNKGKSSITFTDAGVHANTVNGKAGFRSYEEFKNLAFKHTSKVEVSEFAETVHRIELGFDDLSFVFPYTTVENLINLFNMIKTIMTE